MSLGEALGRPFSPVRFVLSTRLDIKPWLAVDPELEFKLDPTPEWDAGLMAEIAATGRVRVLDFKSFYEGSPVDNPPDPEQYRLVSETFPGDSARGPGAGRARARGAARAGGTLQLRRAHPLVGGRRGDHGEGVRGRGPVRRRSGCGQLNVKPSRFGSLSALLDCVERAQAAGMVLYGGGQFELGIGRDQIQALASLLYPGRPQRRGAARVPRRRAPGRAGEPARPLEHQGAGLRVRVRGLTAGRGVRSRPAAPPPAVR